ncbi:MAG TPA: hypothetical protein VFR37_22385 [Longimicrobium sp.]|nr:hypothetical protein [Longimicrobium sp.]
MNRLAALPVLLLAACTPATQSSDGAGAMPPPAPPPPAMAAPSILGDYTVAIAAADVPASAPAEMRDGLVGSWRIAFHGGNHFVVNYNGQDVVQGHYQLSGNQIMFGTGETGAYACNTPATYNWARNGNQLTFTLVGADACDGREIVLTSRPLTRAP